MLINFHFLKFAETQAHLELIEVKSFYQSLPNTGEWEIIRLIEKKNLGQYLTVFIKFITLLELNILRD